MSLLVCGILESEGAKESYHRLLSLPPDLEAFYDQILKQVKQKYRDEASKVLQVSRQRQCSRHHEETTASESPDGVVLTRYLHRTAWYYLEDPTQVRRLSLDDKTRIVLRDYGSAPGMGTRP